MANLDAIVEEFAEDVAAQTDAIRRGDAKTGNQHAGGYIAAFNQLCAAGDPGRDALLRLFHHERPDVRPLWHSGQPRR